MAAIYRDRHVHSDEDARAYIERIISTKQLTYWVVYLQPDHIPAGIVSFLKRNYLEHFDIGSAFLPAHESRGYALEAMAAVLRSVMNMTEHHIVLATTIPGNIKSIKLLQKLGFVFERETEQLSEKLYIYAKTAT